MAESQVLSHLQNALWGCQPGLGMATTVPYPELDASELVLDTDPSHTFSCLFGSRGMQV